MKAASFSDKLVFQVKVIKFSNTESMNTRSYRRLRKGRVVVLGKVDWIEQAKSFVMPEEGLPKGTSIPDRTTTLYISKVVQC